jgi:hypothetical protein
MKFPKRVTFPKGFPRNGATVIAYLATAPETQYVVTADGATGAYAINLPTGAAATGWTVTASQSGYTAASQTGKASNATGVIFNLTAVVGAQTVNANGGAKSETLNGQTVVVDVPSNGVTVNGYILITQAAKNSATAMPGSPTYVYDVKVTSDTAGTTPVAATNIKKIVITLPLDLGVVKPGDLESGAYVIYSASTQALLEAGSVEAVPVANIISVNYMGDIGSVTFWVDHLTWFGIGIGAGSGSGGAGLEEEGSGCFIATAAYGSYFEKHVQILRNFRDAYLMTNDLGRAFVRFYYRHSPAIANVIAKHGSLRAMVRLGLAPFIGVAYVTVHTTPAQKVLILLLMIGILTAGMVMIYRTRKVRRVIG